MRLVRKRYTLSKDLLSEFRKWVYIDIFDDPQFTHKIKNCEFTTHELKNLIVKYFNDVDITVEDLEKLKHIDYMDNKEFFYGIPFAIFCIEQQIAKNLSVNK